MSTDHTGWVARMPAEQHGALYALLDLPADTIVDHDEHEDDRALTAAEFVLLVLATRVEPGDVLDILGMNGLLRPGVDGARPPGGDQR